MKSSTKMMMCIILVMSTLLVMSSNNWISMWMGLEMNLMSFIPTIFESKNNKISQSCMMYFMAQSMGSITFLATILMKKYVENMDSSFIYNVIMVSMAIKLGAPPFHLWLLMMMEKISWLNCLLMMTWQKLAPMYIMSIVAQETMTQLLVIMSSMTGAIMAINQTSTRSIMAYSTMTHMSWMFISMKTSDKMWLTYFCMYTLMVTFTTMYFMHMNVLYVSQASIFSMKLSEKINFILMMMSMGGLPPFFGFLPKWIIISEMIESKEMFIMMFVLFMNLIPLFYYIRLCTPLNMFLCQTQKWQTPKKSLIPKYILITNMLMTPMILTLSFF
uniref:NADH-ubiquinone oxidoreductase chain 2 n=1 Tax=Nesidiocoris poppiusi TaxID=3059073 RepID=A0AAT9VWB5_9HEMI|nr:NADH dehydrogenase subunit 2 [Nesidiocoris poppiusi]WKW91647.1 NADH dehydrogenase subunit 2 [Nesidiocoris poppiusi]